MKIKSDKKYSREYIITVTVQFPLYFSKKEEDEGTEIPHELIKSEVEKCINSEEYDISEEPME